jgi:DNA-binding CsgD family transcriptional regulator
MTGDQARSVIISGPPGVGRTRLAREALAIARDAGRRTRWVTGTGAAAAIPLGAMAHLVPPTAKALDPFTLLQRAMSAIEAEGRDHPLAIAVDDAHLLDELSVTLVQQLVTSSDVAFVITLRPGGPGANQLAALWKDGAARRLELPPLLRADCARLLAAALHGSVDARTEERLWRLSRGHPLFLRELVDGGLGSGHLRAHDGLWRWEGPIRPTPRLVEIVLAELEGTEPAERAALEVLATGEPLSLERLVVLSSRNAVAGLERRRLVIVDRTERPAQARVAHPLYAEVVRDQMPEAAASRIRRELAPDANRRLSHDELRRISRLALHHDDAAGLDGDLLAEAAGQANAMHDHGLAEGLARAAVEARAGVAGHLALVEAVLWAGRPGEAERLAVTAAALAQTADERSRLVVLRAITVFRSRGSAAAESRLDQDLEDVTDERARAVLLATRALLAFWSGRPGEAVDLGTELLADPAAGPTSRPLAAAAVAAGHAVAGRAGAALAAAESGWAALADLPAATGAPFVRLTLAQAELLALSAAGRLAELDRRAGELLQRSMAGPEWAGDAIAALHVGGAALEAGRLGAATRWLTEALSGLRRQDPAGLLPLCAAQLAQAHALLGDAILAGDLLTEAASGRVPAVIEPQLLLAKAWLAAVQTPGTGACCAQAAARLARDRGMAAVEARMLHAAALLGRPMEVAARLRQLAGALDGPLAGVYAEHAEALAADSGERLDDVAAAFEQIGALLLAADAAGCAALAHQRAGDRRPAAGSTAVATRLARACDGARTPGLDQLTPPRLSAREEEVARLAADGLNNQDIAGRLVLSVRTVEAHLASVYTKLGIHRRGQLGEIVPVGSRVPQPRRNGRAAAGARTGA